MTFVRSDGAGGGGRVSVVGARQPPVEEMPGTNCDKRCHNTNLLIQADFWRFGRCCRSVAVADAVDYNSLFLLALSCVEGNERVGARTQDLRIKSPLLYQLSYALPRSRPAGATQDQLL